MREFNTRTAEGDYSITFETDDRKAFEQVQALCRLLIDGKDGDAIPVEWLLDRAQEYLIDRDITASEMKFIKKLIEEWRSLNG